jgi:hypothetical protein
MSVPQCSRKLLDRNTEPLSVITCSVQAPRSSGSAGGLDTLVRADLHVCGREASSTVGVGRSSIVCEMACVLDRAGDDGMFRLRPKRILCS